MKCPLHGIVRIECIIGCVPEVFRDGTANQNGKYLVVDIIRFVPKGNS